MTGQGIHHTKNIRVGRKNLTYVVSKDLSDHTIATALEHASELLPSEKTGNAELDAINLKSDIAQLRKNIIENGPPEYFLKPAPDGFKIFDSFKEFNHPFIKDAVSQRTAFADFIGDVASGEWRELRQKHWTEFESKGLGHSHD